MAAADAASAVSFGTPAELAARKKPLVSRVPPKLQNYYSSWNTMTRVWIALEKTCKVNDEKEREKEKKRVKE